MKTIRLNENHFGCFEIHRLFAVVASAILTLACATVAEGKSEPWCGLWSSFGHTLIVGNTGSLAYNHDGGYDGTITFVSSNPEIASIGSVSRNIDGGTVNITGLRAGEVTVTMYFSETANYSATSRTVSFYVKDDWNDKITPTVTILPAMVTLTEGTSKTVTVDVAYYDGTVTASMVDGLFANVTQTSVENRVYNYRVEGLNHGTTYIKLELPGTDNYRDTTIYVPVSVLSSLSTFELVVVDAPQFGVAIEIWGSTYTGSTSFTSAHGSVSAADVEVHSMSSYNTSVSIAGNTITVTYTLKVPQKGSFLRLKNYSSNQYVSLSADGTALTLAPAGMNNIIYYDADGHFLFYKNGQFVKATHLMASVADGASASTFTFTRGTGEFTACYSILSSEGRYMLGSGGGTATSSVADNGYAFWSVETLSALPVEVTAAGYGYATLYCPVALDIPGGVMAYYVNRKSRLQGTSGVEYELVLEKLVSLIPAGTPVILVGTPGTTYDCTLQYGDKTAAPSGESTLTGHCASLLTADVVTSGTVFAMQPNRAEETVGFYPYAQTSTKGFKAYFVSTSVANAAQCRLVFADEEATSDIALPQLPDTEADGTVYDLLGHRVSDTPDGLRPGIYVRFGRKMVVRR